MVIIVITILLIIKLYISQKKIFILFPYFCVWGPACLASMAERITACIRFFLKCNSPEGQKQVENKELATTVSPSEDSLARRLLLVSTKQWPPSFLVRPYQPGRFLLDRTCEDSSMCIDGFVLLRALGEPNPYCFFFFTFRPITPVDFLEGSGGRPGPSWRGQRYFICISNLI